MSAALRDQFGRSIEYLRISVTDRCNFRCLYCMPAEGLTWLPKHDILSYEEIAHVVRQLAPLGLRRLRITGGEPTIRPQIHFQDTNLADISERESYSNGRSTAYASKISGRRRWRYTTLCRFFEGICQLQELAFTASHTSETDAERSGLRIEAGWERRRGRIRY